jgi:hypothetical protein
MPVINVQSLAEDRWSLHFGENAAIYDLSRADAEQILATYVRTFGDAGVDQMKGARGGPHSRRGRQLNLAKNR